MPYTVCPKQVRKLAAALCGAAAIVVAVPAAASAACPSSATAAPFAQFGDSASYSPLQGGNFETDAQGWSLSHSQVVLGNESYDVAGGTHSLAIEPDGVAVSPAFCIDVSEPSFRFFLRQTSGSWAVLNVILRWTDSSATVHNTTVGSLQTGTSWQPSPVLALGSTLPVSAQATISARLVFQSEPYGGAWAIDDVYIDPHSR
jgi:hypothetical protein